MLDSPQYIIAIRTCMSHHLPLGYVLCFLVRLLDRRSSINWRFTGLLPSRRPYTLAGSAFALVRDQNLKADTMATADEARSQRDHKAMMFRLSFA
jgi:hypothetical protein